jgi:hypothetical protein
MISDMDKFELELRVLSMDEGELPLYINHSDKLFRELVRERLRELGK